MRNNCYTLITGASEGLGKYLALECARLNKNLLLVALPGPELKQLAAFIRETYCVQVIELEMDITVEENCYLMEKLIREKEIKLEMLLNNAGMGGSVLFEEGQLKYFIKQIQLNILSLVRLTHLMLPHLVRERAYILNVSSLSTFFFLPKKQVYGATKSFIYYFSKSLRRELVQKGISVSVVCPGGMNSNPAAYLTNHSLPWIAKLSVMDPNEVARITIEQLLKGKEIIIPGRYNKFYLVLDRIFPKVLKEFITGKGVFLPAKSKARLTSYC